MAEPVYYSRDRQTREGPLSFVELQELAKRGVLRKEHLIWTDGMGEWAAAGVVPGVFADGPPPIPPVPVVPPTRAGPIGGGAFWAEPVYAGFWLRFVAAIIDGFVLLIPSWLVSMLVAGVLGISSFNMNQNPSLGPLVAYVFGSTVLNMMIGWLYFAMMESSTHQATVGKMALGLRVTTEGLEPLTFGRASGRHFAKMISNLTLYIGYIMAGFTERKQALHDLVAGCLVIRK